LQHVWGAHPDAPPEVTRLCRLRGVDVPARVYRDDALVAEAALCRPGVVGALCADALAAAPPRAERVLAQLCLALRHHAHLQLLLRQYVHFCASKASKVSTSSSRLRSFSTIAAFFSNSSLFAFSIAAARRSSADIFGPFLSSSSVLFAEARNAVSRCHQLGMPTVMVALFREIRDAFTHYAAQLGARVAQPLPPAPGALPGDNSDGPADPVAGGPPAEPPASTAARAAAASAAEVPRGRTSTTAREEPSSASEDSSGRWQSDVGAAVDKQRRADSRAGGGETAAESQCARRADSARVAPAAEAAPKRSARMISGDISDCATTKKK
jgi:hypothetical protein